MQDYGSGAGMPVPYPPQPPASRRTTRRWLLIGGLALAFVFTLGLGAAIGSTIVQSVQAASLGPSGAYQGQPLAFGPNSQPGNMGPGMPGQCAVLTVSSVRGQTITARAPDGSAVTIHTTASTHYTRAGQAATASAVTAGVQIHVDGTRNSDGSITATHIDVR
jgi:hypothetical protein